MRTRIHGRILVLATSTLLAGLVLALPPIKRGELIGEVTRAPGSVAKPTAKASAKSVAKPTVKATSKPSATARNAPPPQTGKSASVGMGPMVPFRSAIAVEARTGRVLSASSASRASYPASVTKLMTFLLVLEDLQAGKYKLTDVVRGSHYAASMEPSSVGIRPNETMKLEDLLYAIMIKSANDGAVMLAEHAAWAAQGKTGPIPEGTKGRELVEAFVARMNRRAKELGMTATTYQSPNGLPPARNEKRGFDTSTAEDIAKLCCRLVRIPDALKYTSPAVHTVTDGSGKPLALATHNYFLPGSHDKDGCAKPVEGCDGLKTGYTAVSGSSIALTASRDGQRVVVVVLGSAGRHNREAAALRMLNDALSAAAW